MTNVEDAIDLWIEAALDVIQGQAEFSGWTFALVTIDPAALDDRIERVNITLPRRGRNPLRLYRETGAGLKAAHPKPLSAKRSAASTTALFWRSAARSPCSWAWPDARALAGAPHGRVSLHATVSQPSEML